MNIEGVVLHDKCDGTGFIGDDVCVECMGTGMETVEINIEE